MSDQSPRRGLNRYAQGDTGWDHTDLVNDHDELAIARGAIADRPASGEYDDELYYAVDQRILWRWDEQASDWEAAGGLGSSTQQIPGTSHFEAVSTAEVSTDHVDFDHVDGQTEEFARFGIGAIQEQRTTSVSTSATVIYDHDTVATIFVAGRDGGDIFLDRVGVIGNGSPSVEQITTLNSPAGRTYTTSSDQTELAMGSSTYDIKAVGMDMAIPS